MKSYYLKNLLCIILITKIEFSFALQGILQGKTNADPRVPITLYTCDYVAPFYKNHALRNFLIEMRGKFQAEMGGDFDKARLITHIVHDANDLNRRIKFYVVNTNAMSTPTTYVDSGEQVEDDPCDLSETTTDDGLNYCQRKWMIKERMACWAYDTVPCDRRKVTYFRWDTHFTSDEARQPGTVNICREK